MASSLGIDEARRNVLAMARGNVLEIGVGTGLNLGSYQFCTTNSNNSNAENDGESPPPSCGVTSLTLVDISENMLRQAQSRIESLTGVNDIPIKVIKADATSELSSLFGDGKFDTVVDTFSLCVMGNEGARKCLEQMRHVVKGSDKGGEFFIIYYLFPLFSNTMIDALDVKNTLMDILCARINRWYQYVRCKLNHKFTACFTPKNKLFHSRTNPPH